MSKVTLTKERLVELGFVRKEKAGTFYYQKGIILMVYRESGVWEFCAEHSDDMSGGIPVFTEEDLIFYSKEK